MRKTMVDVSTEDGVADAYLVVPDGDGPFPGVLFFMDAFGLRPRLYEMAERIAERGYAVLAPNLFYRSARSPVADTRTWPTRPERRGKVFAKLMPMMQRLDAWRDPPDTRAYLDFLAAPGRVSPGPDAVVGYCMGGARAAGHHGAPGADRRHGQLPRRHLATDEPDSPHLGSPDHR
ncbi:hypothetical protein GCM10020358_23000 [Amorphoplanes nipponensis]|uniref:dienelactone hydrolase family protein n=1 Tax=Actinoplanes nipponensis TaxID=135950 RepID=UPI0031EE18B7